MSLALSGERPPSLQVSLERRDHAIDGIGARSGFGLALGEGFGDAGKAHQPPPVLLAFQRVSVRESHDYAVADDRGLAAVERRHYVAGEPAQLLGEFGGRETFGPVDHEIFEAGIARLDRLDAVDYLVRAAAEPGLLLYPFAQGGDADRGAGGAPGAAVLVGVADKAERREPFEALVVRRLQPADRLFLAVGEVDAGAPHHVLAELHVAAMPVASLVERLDDIVEDLFAVQRHHRLEPPLGHQIAGAAAGDRHENLDRQVLRPRHPGDLFEVIAAIGYRRRRVEILALVAERLLVEAFEQEVEPFDKDVAAVSYTHLTL